MWDGVITPFLAEIKEARKVSGDSSSPRLLTDIFDFVEFGLIRHCSSRLLAADMWTSCCLCIMLESHDCDLNSDVYDLQPILKSQTVF